MREHSEFESTPPNFAGPNDSRSTDPNLLKQLQRNQMEEQQVADAVTSAVSRIGVVASADAVHDLARRIFGECEFDPPNGVAAIAGEPVLFITPKQTYTMQRMMYFSTAMDKDTARYRVSYVMPDKDHGPNSIRVSFFRGFRPSR